jgi:predicted Zn-dependent protease
MSEGATKTRRRETGYFDGRDETPRPVSLNFGASLEIIEDGVLLDLWPFAEIRGAKTASGALRLRALSAPSQAWLEIHDAGIEQRIYDNCRLLAGEAAARTTTTRRAYASLLLVAASIVAAIWLGVPVIASAIAAWMPVALEQRLGDALDKQVRASLPGKTCAAPQGAAALAKLSERLQSAAALRLSTTIVVVSSRVPNAFALPGGKIYLLSGLLAKAQGEDEVTGVLAHELGHVQHRDHLRRVIADGGAGYLIGLLFGDVSGGGALIYASTTLLFAAHSREAEAEADAFAAQTLAKLGRPSKPMGELLLRITGNDDDGLFTILHDHPLSQARLDYLKAQDRGAQRPPPLTEAEWAALRAICD